MLPTIAEITKLISKATSAFSEMSPAAQKVALGAIALTAAISPTAKVIQGLTTVTGTAKIAYEKLTAAYKKKTAATVEDTAANVTNAKSLDKTAKSAEKTSKGISGIGAAAKSASPYVLAVLAASAMLGAEISRTISTAQKKIEKAYDEKVKKSNDTYEVEISNLTDEYNAYDKKMTAKISEEEKYYNDRIANLDKDLKAQKPIIKLIGNVKSGITLTCGESALKLNTDVGFDGVQIDCDNETVTRMSGGNLYEYLDPEKCDFFSLSPGNCEIGLSGSGIGEYPDSITMIVQFNAVTKYWIFRWRPTPQQYAAVFSGLCLEKDSLNI